MLTGAFLVLAVLEDRAERRLDGPFVDLRDTERGEGLRPVDGLGDAGRLVELEVAQRLDRSRDLPRELLTDVRGAHAQDRELALEVGMTDPVVQAAALQRVVDVACAVRGEQRRSAVSSARNVPSSGTVIE